MERNRQSLPISPASSTTPLDNRDSDGTEILDHRSSLLPHVHHPITKPSAVEEPLQHQNRAKKSMHPSSRRLNKLEILREWKWELLTWLLGTASLLVILVLLLRFNDAPLSAWNLKVQITAMIAVFSQISQSAFLVPVSYCTGQLKWNWFQSKDRPMHDIELFDLASRGPDGSLRLLYRMSWRLQLVTLGAASTILLLAFPTFIQQSVNVTSKDSPVLGANVSIPRAQAYQDADGLFELHFGTPPVSQTGFQRANMALRNAIDRGMLQEHVYASEVTGTCPAERCIWPPYTTLAVCTVVSDVSTLLRQNGADSRNGTDRERPQLGNIVLQGVTPNALNANSTFRSATFAYWSESFGEEEAMSERQTPPNSNDTIPDIAQVYTWYLDPCLQATVDPYENEGEVANWRAFKVSFKLCLQTFETSSATTTESNLLSTEYDLAWSKGSGLGLDDGLFASPKGSSESFGMEEYVLEAIGGQIASTFNVSYDYNLPESYGSQAAEIARVMVPRYNYTNGQCTDTGFGLDGFRRRVDNVAMSLTNEFRTSKSSTNVSGTAWRQTPYITVDFIWLLRPAILFLMITVFLFATMWRSRNTPLWKSSALALKYSRDADNQAQLAYHKQKTASKFNTTRLEGTGGGYQLVDSAEDSREGPAV
ncbi:Nn.00g079030.m01.CDS01 [Neocucurbitaria sp. VM-36]